VARVPATVARASIEGSVARYFASFAANDVDARLDLFADAVRFEDPAGQLVASSRAELRAFWVEAVPHDWDVRFTLERVAIVGDEALATATMSLRAGTRAPAEVVVNCHFVFRSGDGRIVQYRAFFDAASITERLAEG
jgi:ketosteroid isomerase-like protein